MLHARRSIVLAAAFLAFGAFGAPRTASAASYNLTTGKDTFAVGDTFSVDVKLDSADAGINAAQATISFPKSVVQVTAVDKSGSVFDFWLQGPSYSNDIGQVSFIGGSQDGISGKALEVLKITFKVKGSGSIPILFSDGAITASDGSGTNVLSAMNGLQLTSAPAQSVTVVKPAQIVRPVVPAAAPPAKPVLAVPLYPDPGAWNSAIGKFVARWDLPRAVTGVAAVVNRQPLFDPTQSDGLFDNETFSPLSDGVWYLHVRFRGTAGWGPTAHYRIAIDSIPPLGFPITTPGGFDTQDVAPVISYETSDQLSGVGSYEVFIDGAFSTTTEASTYSLPPQQPGTHALLVRATDAAGNAVESRAELHVIGAPFFFVGGIGVTQSEFFGGIIGALCLAAVAGGWLGWYAGRKRREQRLRRVVIAQRDVQTALDMIQKDISVLRKKLDEGDVSAQTERELKAFLAHVSDRIDKDKRYVVENIESIES